MVLSPSLSTFSHLISLNNNMGVAWTGDQYLINYGLCPRWHDGESKKIKREREGEKERKKEFTCGRLPWIFNAQVSNYHSYSIVQAITNKPQPRVIHFISEGKPWRLLQSEYNNREVSAQLVENRVHIANALWRRAYYKVAKKLDILNEVIRYGQSTAEAFLTTSDVPGYLYLQGQLGENIFSKYIIHDEEREREKEREKERTKEKKREKSNKKKKSKKKKKERERERNLALKNIGEDSVSL
mmetsp:Transcript_8153/g.8319  ORF Transcript_8153/g.8319 Transcript_8153/m.8319 type:complete len:242 (+) Transcript_8153:140-865(+)